MTYTFELSSEQIKEVIQTYQSFQTDSIHNYTLFRGKIKTTTLTIYHTGKVLLQGNHIEDVYIDICQLLHLPISNEDIAKSMSIQTIIPSSVLQLGSSIIGTDEVGTGDFFGGIVVCACFVPKEKILLLRKLGVKDSKELSDDKIESIATELIKKITHSVLLLNNDKYNEVIEQKNMNMNKIKAILHSKVIHNLLPKLKKDETYDEIIIDGFTSKEHYLDYLLHPDEIDQKVQLLEKGENQYVAIAAASIIARYYFLKHLENLSHECGVPLKKGASSKVDQQACELIHKHGESYLRHIAKLNFKNIKKAKNIK